MTTLNLTDTQTALLAGDLKGKAMLVCGVALDVPELTGAAFEAFILGRKRAKAKDPESVKLTDSEESIKAMLGNPKRAIEVLHFTNDWKRENLKARDTKNGEARIVDPKAFKAKRDAFLSFALANEGDIAEMWEDDLGQVDRTTAWNNKVETLIEQLIKHLSTDNGGGLKGQNVDYDEEAVAALRKSLKATLEEVSEGSLLAE